MTLDSFTDPRERATAGSALVALTHGDVRPLFQPIVDLEDLAVVGFEALARGRPGSPLELPEAMFSAARTAGQLAELDRACVRAACLGADAGGLSSPLTLFVNVEPEVIPALVEGRDPALLEAAGQDYPIIVEVTERALTSRPAELLAAVAALRAHGVAIALDDVGADRRSLALLPLLHPEVVKLDISLLRGHPRRSSGEVINAVSAFVEASGALLVAEGIEDEEDLHTARALGADLGQGFHLGLPGPLSLQGAAASRSPAMKLPTARDPSESWRLMAGGPQPRVGVKPMLVSLSRALEAQALALGEHAVVIAAFQDVRHFSAPTRRQYERIAARAALTICLGAGFTQQPDSRILAVELDPRDPLCDHWVVVVLGPHYSGALLAWDLGDEGPDHQRRFSFTLTFDRGLVSELARVCITRLAAPAGVGAAQSRHAQDILASVMADPPQPWTKGNPRV